MGIWPVSKGSRLNRILTIRWSGQLTDGLFQSALASFVLFSPERAPNAISAALAFAVVLLPYSLIGPYVGIFLDRFSRQRIIRNCNYLRAANLLIIAWLVNSGSTGIVLTLFVLFAFGVNRLILSGLSAGLPLLVKREELIAANALAVTGGTIWVVIGGGIGIGIKNLLSQNSDADFADAVLQLLAEFQVPAHYLAIEITERALIDKIEQAKTTIAQLRAAGMRVFLDDFGTGYSSLSYLHEFQLDVLKIDRSFIAGIRPRIQENAVVNTIIALAKTLKLSVIAEGIENSLQRKILADLGCDSGQGYWFAAALPARQAVEWLR